MVAEIKGRLCVLRPWREADVDALVRLADNHAVARMLRDKFPHPYNRSAARDWIDYAAVAERELALAVTCQGELAGGIGLGYGCDVGRYSAEIGYWLGEAFWGRGLATDAVRTLSDHAFGTLRLLRLFGIPFADNVASCRVLEKAGYVREGLMRAGGFKEGKVRDQLLYARVNSAWRVPE